MTVISAVPRYWGIFVRLNFARARLMRRLRGPSTIDRRLKQLTFVHFAHWSVFDRVPARGGRKARRFPHPYLLFQSNFNGGTARYVEGFSVAVPTGMRAIWGRAYGVPPPVPVGPFLEYILDNQQEPAYYWGAYPEASTHMVLKALELRQRFHEFAREASDLEPERFAAAHSEFLTDVQRLL